MALFLLLFLLLFLCIWSGTTAEGVGQDESRQFMKWDTLPARDNMSMPKSLNYYFWSKNRTKNIHFTSLTLEVVCEEMLGRADDNFSDSNNVDILQLGNLGEHLSDLAKVAHVDPPVVNRVRQGLTVHGRSAMVEAVPDESWDLDSDQEVCSILDQLAFLLELTLVFWMDHARGKHIWVEPVPKCQRFVQILSLSTDLMSNSVSLRLPTACAAF